MLREIYEQDHEDFRGVAREFALRSVADQVERWDEAGATGRDVWLEAGRQGILGLSAPVGHGGAGQLSDFRFRNVLIEELANVHAACLNSGFALQDDIAIPYLAELGTDEQQARWLPRMVTGELIGAVAMTEPDAGSDLRGLRTSGRKVDGGWLVNGAKTFITNGLQSDLVVTVTRTDPGGGSHGFTLLVVERDMNGFSRGRKLRKVGLHAQDTAELWFDDVFVPDANVLGEVGAGLGQLHQLLPLERLSIAAQAVAHAAAILRTTLDYVRGRKAFGGVLADFQNTRFELADLATDIEAGRSLLDRAIVAFNRGALEPVDAAQVKLWTTEMQHRVVDRCLQLHGGYGYLIESPVGRAYQDARVQRIFGGTSEIMRHIIGRALVGGGQP